MKRNLMSVLQQRSRSTFLKWRAPCAAARTPAADGRSQLLDPPTAEPLALLGAAAPSDRAQPRAVLPSGATQNRAAPAPWLPNRSSVRSRLQGQQPAACSR